MQQQVQPNENTQQMNTTIENDNNLSNLDMDISNFFDFTKYL